MRSWRSTNPGESALTAARVDLPCLVQATRTVTTRRAWSV